MRRVLLAFAAILAAMTLSACDEGGGDQGGTTPPASESPSSAQ